MAIFIPMYIGQRALKPVPLAGPFRGRRRQPARPAAVHVGVFVISASLDRLRIGAQERRVEAMRFPAKSFLKDDYALDKHGLTCPSIFLGKHDGQDARGTGRMRPGGRARI